MCRWQKSLKDIWKRKVFLPQTHDMGGVGVFCLLVWFFLPCKDDSYFLCYPGYILHFWFAFLAARCCPFFPHSCPSYLASSFAFVLCAFLVWLASTLHCTCLCCVRNELAGVVLISAWLVGNLQAWIAHLWARPPCWGSKGLLDF